MKLCYVTGVPGVGKTSVCKEMASRGGGTYRHLGFGRYIILALGEAGYQVEEPELRRQTSGLVTRTVLSRSVDLFVRELEAAKAQDGWVLVDSHAVSQDWFGFIAAPDGQDYFGRVKYDAVVHLYTEPALVLRRSNQEETGRLARRESDISMHDSLLRGVSLLYASNSGCPVYFVEALSGVEPTADRIAVILGGLTAGKP